jgi:hypothetical protein
MGEMTCSLIDLPCHLSNAAAPIFTFWQTWDLLIVFVAGLLVGGFLGWRIVLAVLTLGIGFFIYERTRKDTDPAFETGEPEPAPKPKKRKTTVWGKS